MTAASLARLALWHAGQLTALNAYLQQCRLPPFWLGGTAFNTDYRLSPLPRWVWWRLTEIYLIYKPGTTDERKIIYTV